MFVYRLVEGYCETEAGEHNITLNVENCTEFTDMDELNARTGITSEIIGTVIIEEFRPATSIVGGIFF